MVFCLRWEKTAAVEEKGMYMSHAIPVYQTATVRSRGKSKLHTAFGRLSKCSSRGNLLASVVPLVSMKSEDLL